jgi:hypothetical protein
MMGKAHSGHSWKRANPGKQGLLVAKRANDRIEAEAADQNGSDQGFE